MKVSREEAEANHERIIDAASRLFRQKGFDGISVAELMTAAGLTHGGFYGHFKSKDDLVSLAVQHALARSGAAWTSITGDADKPFAALIDRYLDEAKLAEPGPACMFAALAPEGSRRSGDVRRAFADGFRSLTGILAGLLPAALRSRRRAASIAVFSEMVGALVLARSVDDPDLAREILRIVKADLKSRFPDKAAA
ncbi:TetR/AcrR family transcriptional regulator [Pseudorhodoplanes sp.]|jgi:TetR/AcrR family transcriptional repressor of nem operon|uniref:TetR/AcrR family transcriptional regulator n=1 Tax=Pseudorhodoplanes sp. TaxID=1934341 RepID=UPI002CDE294E|nr:TetR/AcrR family transcriptional regulator [Pseudorhodoplanes sp.]HWV43896.1 TetR/AcrR family transcriptional regulator [Pseudorhodoplanes sp.]